MKLLFHGEVKQGKFVPDMPEVFLDSFIAHEGRRVTVSVSRYRKPRTIKQNNALHGIAIKMLSDHLGYEMEEMKGIIKWVFKVKHTSELSTVEENELYARIQRWSAQEFNLIIPDPNEAEA